MPFDPEIDSAIRQKKTIDFDFSAMSPEDANALIDTTRQTVTDAGLADDLEAARKQGKSGTLDYSHYTFAAPGGMQPPGMMAQAGHALGDAWDYINKPFGWAETSAKGNEDLGTLLGNMALGPGPAHETTPDIFSALAPRDQAPVVPAMTPSSQPFTGSEAGVAPPSNASSEFARAAISAPFDVGAALTRGIGSPLGIGTLPVAELAGPLRTGASLLEQVAPRAASYAAMYAEDVSAIPSAFTMASTMAGKALSPMADSAKLYAIATADAVAPGVTGPLRTVLAEVMRPASLRQVQNDLTRSTIIETSEQLDFAKNLMETMTPEQNEHIMLAFQVTQGERMEALQTYKAMAEQVTPEEVLNIAMKGAQGFERVDLMAEILKANQDALMFKRMSMNRFAERLPEDIKGIMKVQARARGAAMLTTEEQAIFHEVQNRFEDWADRQIAAKVAGPEAFSVQKGTFVPDFYLQHELDMESRAFSGPGESFGMRAVRGDLERLQTREVTNPVDKLNKGLQMSVPYAFTKGAIQETFDANIGEAIASVRANPDLASPMRRAPGWVQMDGKKYMALKGMYVHPSVKLWLDGTATVRTGLDRLGRSIASMWKQAVTAYNPPVHFGNIVPNSMMLECGGIDLISDFGKVRRAISSYRNGDATYNLIRSTGLVGSKELRQKETEEFMSMALKSFNEMPDGQTAAIDLAHRVITEGPSRLKKILTSPAALYNAEEDLFKYIMAHVAHEHGIPLHGVAKGDLMAAVRHSEKWQFNTNDVSPLLREVRLGPAGVGALMVAPFATYQTKVIPRMVESAFKSPLVFMKWHAMFQGLNRASMHAMGMTDEHYQQFRDLRSQNQEYGFMRAMTAMAPVLILPMRDRNGNAMAIDMSRFTPYGQAFQPRGIPLLGVGPLTQSFVGALTGKGAMGNNLFDPNAEDSIGSVNLYPSMRARKTLAAVNPFIPPVVKRGAIGALSAMGPKYSATAPLNTPAALLEMLGSQGATTPQGTLQTPGRQVASALVGQPESVDLKFMKTMQEMSKRRKAMATEGQARTDAIHRSKYMKAQRKER